MLVVKIKGGLGNQMFEYAMAKRLQIMYGIDRIGLELSVIEQDSLRECNLSAFALYDRIEIINWPDRIVCLQEFLRKKLVSYFIAGRKEETAEKREDFLAGLFAVFGIVQRDHSQIEEHLFLRFHKNLYLNGWFQNAKKLLPIREELLADFKMELPELADSNICKQIQACNAVCVHIRRGDYVKHPIFDVCTDDYYYRAIEYMISNVKNPVFFIFSDDIEQIKETMNFTRPSYIQRIIYIDENHEPYEDLYLMQQCRHFIISNSTFSWWAQFLGNAPDKIVVAPARWRNGEYNNRKSIYMEKWILMEV